MKICCILFLAINNTCDINTQDCSVNENNGSIICTCKKGYEEGNTPYNCTGIMN